MKIDLLLIGCGGTGGCFYSRMVRFLSDTELHDIDFQFRIMDGDFVESKNLSRQPFSVEDIGKNKAVALATIAEETLGVKVKAYPEYLNEGNVSIVHQFIASTNSFEDVRIIIGAVDNHVCRKILHHYFRTYKGYQTLIYVDSANELSCGEVVIGTRTFDKIMTPDRVHYYPEILKDNSKAPYELSCEELNQAAPQHLATNGFAGDILFSYVSQVINAGPQAHKAPGGIIYFDAFKMFSRFDFYEEVRHGKIES